VERDGAGVQPVRGGDVQQQGGGDSVLCVCVFRFERS